MKVLGIDIGTTTISLVVLDPEQKKVWESRTISNGTFMETAREWERIQDVNKIVEKTREVLEGLLHAYPEVSSIGLTGQMHGILYVDREGRCISPLYTWQDGRGNVPDEHGKTLTEMVREKTGITVFTGYGLVTHLWNQLYGEVPEEAVGICTIADYLGMCLTGRKQPLLHASNAASLGFYDVKEHAFRRDILQDLAVNTEILPEVCQNFEQLGTYRGIPVTVAIGDNQASFLGSVGLKERTLLLNMGTGGQISVLSPNYFEAPGIEARPITEGNYLLVGASLCGGRAYAILERFLRSYVGTDESQYEKMEQLARAGQQQKDRMKVNTTFNGTRVHPELRGSILNVSEENFTPEGLVYGVLEGMAAELYEMFRMIQKGTGIQAEHLIASGNGLRRNPVLQEICSDMFGAVLTLADYREEAACGAAVSSR